MKCKNCKNEIPDGSSFCAFCGANLQAPKCKKCGAELVDGATFCSICGTNQNAGDTSFESINEKKSTKKIPKKKHIFRNILLSILGVTLIGIAVVAFKAVKIESTYQKGLTAFSSGNYEDAFNCFESSGEYKDALKYKVVSKLMSGYPLTDAETNFICSTFDDANFTDVGDVNYKLSIIFYKGGKYSKAENGFKAYEFNPYEDSDKYLALCEGRHELNSYFNSSVDESQFVESTNNLYDKLLSNLDFEDAKEVLINNTALASRYLTGTWKTADGKYINVKEEAIYQKIYPTMPNCSPETNISELQDYWFFYAGRGKIVGMTKPVQEEYGGEQMYQSTALSAATCEIIDKDTMIITLSNGKTYTLTRA